METKHTPIVTSEEPAITITLGNICASVYPIRRADGSLLWTASTYLLHDENDRGVDDWGGVGTMWTERDEAIGAVAALVRDEWVEAQKPECEGPEVTGIIIDVDDLVRDAFRD